MQDIIFNPLLKLSNVNRYSGIYLQRPEPVTDHTTQTGLLCILVANALNKRFIENGSTRRVNMEKLALKALLHDVDEALTCDVPRNVKYYNKTILNQLNEVSRSVMQKVCHKFDLMDVYATWENCKDKSLEGYILKICDLLQVLRKVVEEIEILGNKNMLQVAAELSKYLEEYYGQLFKSSYDFMDKICLNFFQDLLKDSLQINQHLVIKYKSDISDYYFSPSL